MIFQLVTKAPILRMSPQEELMMLMKEIRSRMTSGVITLLHCMKLRTGRQQDSTQRLWEQRLSLRRLALDRSASCLAPPMVVALRQYQWPRQWPKLCQLSVVVALVLLRGKDQLMRIRFAL